VKLNPEELEVVTFATDGSHLLLLPTIGTNDPTPATNCDDCMSPTFETC
jgi:hypothetical protein